MMVIMVMMVIVVMLVMIGAVGIDEVPSVLILWPFLIRWTKLVVWVHGWYELPVCVVEVDGASCQCVLWREHVRWHINVF